MLEFINCLSQKKYIFDEKIEVKNNILTKAGIVSIGLFALAVLSRVVPHPPNFAALGAIGLFGAAFFTDKKWAFIVPIAAWWFSDLLLNATLYSQTEGFVLLTNYQLFSFLAMFLIILVGMKYFQKLTLTSVLGGSLAAAIIFFVVSNLGVWLSTAFYPKTFAGLSACFAAALPFFGWSLLGNVVYLFLLERCHTWFLASKLIPQKA